MAKSSSSGIGFFGLLAVALIVLKLTDVIDISWWWIALIALAPVIIILMIIGIIYFIWKQK